MNTKVLIIFFALLAVFLLLPVVAQVIKGGGSTPPVTLDPNAPKAPPLLNESNLVGTGWSVKTPEMPLAVTITLNAGGQAVATVPAVFAALARQQLGTDTLTGTWRAQGDKLTATVEVKGQTHSVDCDIVGDKLYYEGREIKRMF